MRIYLDAGSIHNEMCRRHPEIEDGYCWLDKTTDPIWATVMDTTGCVDGPADIVWDERYTEDYYGFTIEMLRLKNVSADYWLLRNSESPKAADAVDPSADSTGNPTTRV